MKRKRYEFSATSFFWLFYAINKRIMQSTHSLQLKQSPPALFFSIICGFFINYLTLFLDGRNERHSGLFFRQKMHYYWLFIYWNVIFFLAGQRIPMSFVDFPHRWSTRTRFNDVLFKIVIPPLKRILTWHLIDARLFDYYCGNNWHNSYLLFSRSLSLCPSLYWLYSIDYSQRFHLLLDDTLDPMTVQRLVARKNTRK